MKIEIYKEEEFFTNFLRFEDEDDGEVILLSVDENLPIGFQTELAIIINKKIKDFKNGK
jgi:hypothetical protein